jgi:hypothetical protein
VEGDAAMVVGRAGATTDAVVCVGVCWTRDGQGNEEWEMGGGRAGEALSTTQNRNPPTEWDSFPSLMGDREASRGERVMQRTHGGPVVRRSSRNEAPWMHSLGG